MALSLITDISATCYTSQLQKIELVWICCRVSHLLPSANLLQRQRADAHFQRVIQHAIKSCRHLRHRLATRNLFSRQGRGAAVHFLFLQRHGQPRTDLRCHLLQAASCPICCRPRQFQLHHQLPHTPCLSRCKENGWILYCS